MSGRPRVGFVLRCRFAGCKSQMVVHVTRSNDPRMEPLETTHLSPHAGWVLMFRTRDEFTILAAALCSEHAGNWEDDEP